VQAEDNVVELSRDREAPVAPLSFEELSLEVHDRLYRALYFITGSSADAEELMQDAFLKLWERRPGVRGGSGALRAHLHPHTREASSQSNGTSRE
jgi:DNA-directed RNA polymerase specialized sigma24 family protein